MKKNISAKGPLSIQSGVGSWEYGVVILTLKIYNKNILFYNKNRKRKDTEKNTVISITQSISKIASKDKRIPGGRSSRGNVIERQTLLEMYHQEIAEVEDIGKSSQILLA